MSAASERRVIVVVRASDEASGRTEELTQQLARRLGDAVERVELVETRLDGERSIEALVEEIAARLDGRVVAAAPSPDPDPDPDPGSDDEIAIVGMGVALPRASSPDELWQLLCGDTPVFTEPGERLSLESLWSADPAAPDRTYSRVAGFMTDFTPHPKLRAEIASGEFSATEHTAVWLRHCIWQATDGVRRDEGERPFHAFGLTPDGSHHLEHSLVRDAAKQVLGAESDAALAAALPFAGAIEDNLPYRIARLAAGRLPPGGEVVAVDTACSSSLYAIDLGIRALRSGQAELALCGGAFALNAQSLVLFSKLQGLSKSGQVRSLDGGSDGVLFSDGAAVIAMKTRRRALADGDPILGYLAGFGGSSDGRGKAIYAPNAAGQKLALHRAWRSAGLSASDIEWVIAHATGTPTGDKTELTALTENGPADRTWTVTSNKSLVGHTGWAAGAVSVVHALLAMRHQRIPAQQRFTSLPKGVEVGARLEVPVAPRPWLRLEGMPRRVGVSAMGFGGTNGHLIVSDQPPAPRKQAVRASDRSGEALVITGWAAHLPGSPSTEAIAAWLAGGAPSWPASFGASYPALSPLEAKLAPSAIMAMDRSQLMALRLCAELGGEWTKQAELTAVTGVFVGHSGPTRSAVGHDLRCYLNELTARAPELDHARLRALADQLARPATEDSYPGLMPNIIAARVAQRLDLHGPNMTLDAGRDSVAAAIATAARYLRDGELELAIILGVNAQTAHRGATTGPEGSARGEVAEAAFGLRLTRRSVALARGWEILGELAVQPPGSAVQPPAITRGDGRCYRGARGAVEILRALHRGEAASVSPVEDAATPSLRVASATTATTAATATTATTATTAATATTATTASATTAPAELGEPPLEAVLARHAVALCPRPGQPASRLAPRLLAEPTLVVTDLAERIAELELPAGSLVVEPNVVAEELGGFLGERSFRHVLLVASGGDATAGDDATAVTALARRCALADLAFAAAQRNAADLQRGGSYAALLLDAFEGAVPRPYTAVFTGLVRSLEQELGECATFALVTEERELGAGVAALIAEAPHHRHLPLAYHRGGARLEQMLLPLDESAATIAARRRAPALLPPRPVVLATGGARGLTAHLVDQICADSAPRAIWLLGAGPAPGRTAELPRLPRAEALRALMAAHPGENLARINKRYEAGLHEAARAATMRRLAAAVGGEHVHYRQCDVLDAAAVQAVVDEVLAVEGGVDVVVHGAGLVRSAQLSRKKLGDLRAVRDVKVLGHAHLRAAFGARQPAFWCDLSSVSAFMGRLGEPDYCAGNEYLSLAAAAARANRGRDEVALMSALWVESGMASADTVGGAFLVRQGDIGQMTDRQGRDFFAAELRGRGSHQLGTTWIGDSDWATLERKAPGFRAACRAMARGTTAVPAAATVRPAPAPATAAAAPARELAFLRGARKLDGARGQRASWLCELDLTRHAYLLDHLVDDRPTLPGTFILELAAEAAYALAADDPGASQLRPVRLTDISLSRFIRAPRDRWPRKLQVTAERRSGDGEGLTIAVRVATPAQGPVAELEHARLDVHLARATSPQRALAPPLDAALPLGRPSSDPYHLPGASVALGGVFPALAEARLLPDGGAAELSLTMPEPGDGAVRWDDFLLPSVALDALLRTIALDGRNPEAIDVLVPTALADVTLHTAANDRQLAARWPRGISLRHQITADGEHRHAAHSPEGALLLSARGVSGAVRATWEPLLGRWRAAQPRPAQSAKPAGAAPGTIAQ